MDASLERSPDDTRYLRLPSSRQMNVKKSIDLLNDAVKISGRPSYRQMSLRHVDYTPSSMASRSLGDVSDSGGMFTPSSMLATPSMRATPGNSTMASSTLTTPHSQTHLGQGFDEEVTVTNIALLLEENPGIAACHGMFADFAESFSSASAQHELFEPLSRYEQICRENVDVLQRLASRSVPTHSSSAGVLDMLSQLVDEQQTWQLVISLYRDRLDARTDRDVMAHCVSEKMLVDSLFESDADLRQAQLVVDWLEHSSANTLDNCYNKVDFSSDRMGAWENTLYMLKQQKAVGARAATARTIVDRLDPDAPLRQGRQLLDLDVADDMQLLEYMFACIRAGQIDEGRRVCVKVGQMWRAATLEGWRLYHDPNLESPGPAGSVLKVQGNSNRDLWKSACWKLSEDERLPLVERAVYAALCANLHQLLPYLQSWPDYVWAYFRVLVDQRVENHIHSRFTRPQPLVPLPSSYPDEVLSSQRIFEMIQSCQDEKVLAECSKQFCIIQKFIITDNANSLIDEMFKWCGGSTTRSRPQLLRFMAHLVLFFRAIGITEKEDMCNAVLKAFIEYLIDEKAINLVAVYVATLPCALQIELYARLLKGVHETDQRRHCLDLGERHGIDILTITKLVVESVSNTGWDDAVSTDFVTADTELNVATTDEDLMKINSLEWLTLRKEQRSEALRQANSMMRCFLGSHKLQACRLASRKIPPDSLELITGSLKDKAGDVELPADDENAVREYLCISAYLDAQESFTDWFEHWHNARPAPPAAEPGTTFSERVAHEHRQQQYQQELDRWQHSLDLQTKVTVDKMYNVLLFVDGGWMVDVRTDGSDECRRRQMLLLRRLCLPSLCMLLHQVLHATKRYKQCVQIADCVADEHHQLYKVFRPDELQNLLKKIRESSLALLDAGMDPLGYELS